MEHGAFGDQSKATFSLTEEDHTLANAVRFTLNQELVSTCFFETCFRQFCFFVFIFSPMLAYFSVALASFSFHSMSIYSSIDISDGVNLVCFLSG